MKQLEICGQQIAISTRITNALQLLETSTLLPLANISVIDQLPAGFRPDDEFETKVESAKSIIKHYLAEGYALFVATSLGKDSSVLGNIVLVALKEFVAEHGSAPEVVFIHSDTKLENPVMHAYSHGELIKIKTFAEAHQLPVHVEVATPNLSNDYLVNVIGGRTIASVPGSGRKCAKMMKVVPLQSLKKRVLKRLHQSYDGKVLSLVGKRYDESKVREQDMVAAGERPDRYIERSGEKLLSLIASFTLDDIFNYIGCVRSDLIDCYSDFDGLVQLYKGANGGDCMVNAVEGKAGSTSCGARFGCWACTQVNFDKSMENMIAQPEYAYMRPLWDFRNYLQACHHDPARRTWLSRSTQNGQINISPVSYSPEFTEELLMMALSIQADEEHRAALMGKAPRFELLSLLQVLGIDVLWGRYGYHRGLQACAIWHKVYVEGERTYPPAQDQLPSFPKMKKQPEAYVPFVDAQYNDIAYGFRDLSMMVLDQESVVEKGGEFYADVNVEDEYSIDEEGAELFFGFELEHALSSYNDDHYAPAAGLHYLMRLGVVSIAKGQHSEYERMVRMSNQVWRAGLRDHLNDPDELAKRLTGNKFGFELNTGLIPASDGFTLTS